MIGFDCRQINHEYAVQIGRVSIFTQVFLAETFREAGRGAEDLMTRALVNTHCATLPVAQVSDPWGGGHDAWKVGGKMFAVVGVMEDGVSVKCADTDTARLLIEMGRAVRAPYFHASWVRVPWGVVSDDEIRERLTKSYQIICAGLPKKVQAALG
jgi:predicted DNA-binding protein (MmcQ/YjbR family)